MQTSRSGYYTFLALALVLAGCSTSTSTSRYSYKHDSAPAQDIDAGIDHVGGLALLCVVADVATLGADLAHDLRRLVDAGVEDEAAVYRQE